MKRKSKITCIVSGIIFLSSVIHFIVSMLLVVRSNTPSTAIIGGADMPTLIYFAERYLTCSFIPYIGFVAFVIFVVTLSILIANRKKRVA